MVGGGARERRRRSSAAASSACACAYELAKAGAQRHAARVRQDRHAGDERRRRHARPAHRSRRPRPDAAISACRRSASIRAIVAELEAAVRLRPRAPARRHPQGRVRRRPGSRRCSRRSPGSASSASTSSGSTPPMCREARAAPHRARHRRPLLPGEGSVSNQLLALALERAAIARGADHPQRAPPSPASPPRAGRVTAVRTPRRRHLAATPSSSPPARARGQIAERQACDIRPRLPVRAHPRPDDRARRHVDADPQHRLGPRRLPRAARQRPRLRRRHRRGRRLPPPHDEGRPRARCARWPTRSSRSSPPRSTTSTGPACAPAPPTTCPSSARSPAATNVIAATGHYRNGILLGPITARLVAQGITTGDWTPAAPFSPARFVPPPPSS